MKKILYLFLVLFSFSTGLRAQMAFVDSKSILDKMPDFSDSVAKINHQAAVWQKEIDDRQAMVDMMTVDFQRDEPMLSDSIKKERSDAIFTAEKSLHSLQRSRFGYQGNLSMLNDSLLGPLRKRVSDAIQVVASRLGYKVVLDKSEGLTVLYCKPELDISEEVMKETGIK
jgi:outer membrane protein